MSDHIYNVLFLCTSNAARSIMAEAQLNALGHGAFKAYSAGSVPSGAVDPLTIDFLQKAGLPTEGLRSKSWDEFALPGAPVIDYVITLCDDAAGETPPVWPGHPVSAHWGVTDPLAAGRSEDEHRQAIKNAAATLHKRIELFTSLPIRTLDRMSLQAQLHEIGQAG
jgi:arsenate reductase